MKRTIAILLSAVLLVSLLTACSGTAMYDDRYGNVSSTPNGNVNGYNRYDHSDRSYSGSGENRTGFAGGNASGSYAGGSGMYAGDHGTGMIGGQ